MTTRKGFYIYTLNNIGRYSWAPNSLECQNMSYYLYDFGPGCLHVCPRDRFSSGNGLIFNYDTCSKLFLP